MSVNSQFELGWRAFSKQMQLHYYALYICLGVDKFRCNSGKLLERKIGNNSSGMCFEELEKNFKATDNNKRTEVLTKAEYKENYELEMWKDINLREEGEDENKEKYSDY